MTGGASDRPALQFYSLGNTVYVSANLNGDGIPITQVGKAESRIIMAGCVQLVD